MSARGTEVQIALSAVAALEDEFRLTVFVHIADYPAAFRVLNDRTERNVDIHVFAVFAVALVRTAFAAVFGDVFAFIHKVYKAGSVPVRDEIYIAALAAVSAVGSAVGDALIPHERYRAVSAVARLYGDCLFV